MDFVFDRTADGRVIKCLVIVDDATHEPVAIEVERAISGHGMSRVLDRLALSRGLPKVLRTDNGKEFCGKAMATWAHERGIWRREYNDERPKKALGGMTPAAYAKQLAEPDTVKPDSKSNRY